MIPILISLAKRLTSNIIGWFKRNYKAMAVIIITILAAICFYQNNQLDKKNRELDRVTNNYLYYEQLATQQKNDNRVLQLTLDEFKETKDSLIQEVHATVKKLKIKEKELKQVQIQEQKVVHDTTIVVRSTDFKVEIKPNNLTSIVINKRDTLLTTFAILNHYLLNLRKNISVIIRIGSSDSFTLILKNELFISTKLITVTS